MCLRGEVVSPGSQAGVQALHLLRRVLHPHREPFCFLTFLWERRPRSQLKCCSCSQTALILGRHGPRACGPSWLLCLNMEDTLPAAHPRGTPPPFLAFVLLAQRVTGWHLTLALLLAISQAEGGDAKAFTEAWEPSESEHSSEGVSWAWRNPACLQGRLLISQSMEGSRSVCGAAPCLLWDPEFAELISASEGLVSEAGRERASEWEPLSWWPDVCFAACKGVWWHLLKLTPSRAVPTGPAPEKPPGPVPLTHWWPRSETFLGL